MAKYMDVLCEERRGRTKVERYHAERFWALLARQKRLAHKGETDI